MTKIKTDQKDLIELIKKDKKEKAKKYIANSYYNYKPKPSGDFEIDVADTKGTIRTIKVKNDVIVYINYFKLLVNQKIEYLLSKEPTIKAKMNYTITTITDMLKTLMLNASLDGTSWLHFYVEDNILDWIIINDSEIIPIFDNKKKNIISIIRYYDLDKDKIKVETWDVNGVTNIIIDKDKVITEQETTHIQTDVIYNNVVIDTNNINFPFIPFIPFYNNKDKASDIDGIQELLDFYNEISGGFISNIYKFQEALTKLKGFSGDEEVLKETTRLMKKYSMVGIPEGGDIEPLTTEIPVEARKFMLELLKDAIFKIGRGYDSDKIGDGNITNIVIKSRYFPLDNKANEVEAEEKKFFEKFVNCINLYYNSNYNAAIDNNRHQLFNESERLEDCIKAVDLVNAGLLSKETLITNIPWVIDVKKELKLIEGQNPTNVNTGQNPINEEEAKNE